MASYWIVFSCVRLGWIFQSTIFEVIGLPQYVVWRYDEEGALADQQNKQTSLYTSYKTISFKKNVLQMSEVS